MECLGAEGYNEFVTHKNMRQFSGMTDLMAHVGSTFLHTVFPRSGAFLWMKRKTMLVSTT